jgi:hypothetical protein
LAQETLGIAADAAAADVDWIVLAEMITGTAQDAWIEPEVIERELARSQQLARSRPEP